MVGTERIWMENLFFIIFLGEIALVRIEGCINIVYQITQDFVFNGKNVPSDRFHKAANKDVTEGFKFGSLIEFRIL